MRDEKDREIGGASQNAFITKKEVAKGETESS